MKPELPSYRRLRLLLPRQRQCITKFYVNRQYHFENFYNKPGVFSVPGDAYVDDFRLWPARRDFSVRINEAMRAIAGIVVEEQESERDQNRDFGKGGHNPTNYIRIVLVSSDCLVYIVNRQYVCYGR